MIPKSLSATSVQAFEACPSRWVAEYFLRAPQPSSTHADLGTACHGALELYVKNGYHQKHEESYDALISFYTDEYERLFTDNSRYDEGVLMLHKWWERADWTSRTVLSTEQKQNFPIKSGGVEVPFNYIWDHADRIEGKPWVEIVDYKTVARPISADGLKDKIQARCYGLAGQIAYPEAEKVWVTFDLLRHDAVGIVFTREENVATYRYLQRVLKRILAMEPDDAPEQLNADCRWCVRKQVCTALQSHVTVGGALSVSDPDEAIAKRYLLENQKKAIDSAIGELDGFLLEWAEREDTLDHETDDLSMNIVARRSRVLDSQRAMDVVGPDLVAEYGSFGVTAVDKLLKDARITDDQRAALKELIRVKYGEPSVKISPKNPIDGI